MKKEKMVKEKKTKKNNLSNTNDPKITLVGEFKWHNIYIMWDKFIAKELSEYMELWFQAIQIIDKKYDDHE